MDSLQPPCHCRVENTQLTSLALLLVGNHRANHLVAFPEKQTNVHDKLELTVTCAQLFGVIVS